MIAGSSKRRIALISFVKPFRYFLFFAGLLCLTACITPNKFGALPTQSADFRLPPTELRASYPDIDKYDKELRAFFLVPPLADVLIEKWGEPQQKESQWLSYSGPYLAIGAAGVFWGPVPPLVAGGWLFAVKPVPTVDYYWLKEDYCIRASIDRHMANGYQIHMHSWTWHYLGKSAPIPDGCRLKNQEGSILSLAEGT